MAENGREIRKLVSHRCQHLPALTSSQLADIRLLLGAAAATSTTAATTATVRTGRGQHPGQDGDTAALARPLAGRRVMVPAIFSSSTKLMSSSKYTPRAFFEGVLRPTHRTAAEDEDVAAASASNEVIHVNVGDHNNEDEYALVEMTCVEALRYFDGESTENQRNPSIPATTTSSSVATKSKTSTSTSSTTKAHSTTRTPSNAATHDVNADIEDEMQHPFMEIRETCNNQGQIQHSEVVNMSNAMKRLGERLQGVASCDNLVGGGGDNNLDVRKLGTILAQTLAGVGQDEIEGGNTVLGGEDFDMSDKTDDHREKSYLNATKKMIDETKYQELRSRLDELQRLEEEEECERKRAKEILPKKMESGGNNITQSSTSFTTDTRLGSGWSRGFLESTKQTKKKVGDPNNRTTRQYAKAKEEEVNSTRVTFCSDEQISMEINQSIDSTPSSPNSARVKFSSRDDTITTTTTGNIYGGGSIDGQSSSKEVISLSPNSAKVTFTVSDDTISSSASSSSSSRMLFDAIPSAPDLLPRSSNSARVTFSDDDVINEIPRIGQSKVPPRPVSAPRPVAFNDQPRKTTNLNMKEAPSLRSPSVPCEENIFGGVVKERALIEGTSGDVTESLLSRERSDGDGGKKLSRFAQQRLQRR